MIHDGHVHTPFCPHGTKDGLADYCEKAIKLGIKGITFAEHAPLPPSFTDPTPLRDSAMDRRDLEKYFEEVKLIKKEYERFLTIFLGLEVDYIEGYEEETTNFLNEVGPYLDDSILSVHFLKIANEYLCIDYSPDVFNAAIQSLGSIEKVYVHYFNTVLSSIKAELGPYKPKRIGHLTLVRKFQKRFPTDYKCENHLKDILTLMKEKNYEVDYNGAGHIKPLCKETYPYAEAIKMATALGVPLVYGSDAHQTTALMSGFKQLVSNAPLQSPKNN